MVIDAPSATELVRLLRTGAISAREAVEWHVERILAVDPSLNAVVVPLFEAALTAATAADDSRARGDDLGPLHGLPVTVKECFDLAGTDSSAGVSALAGRPAMADSAIVAALRSAGAIILGKTNVSQLVWFSETDNPIFGRTNNPWNLARSPGGSSGGEAAIVAAGGSALGVGTDSGGSVRLPAHYCGIHAFKPTAGTLSAAGTLDERLFRGTEARAFNQPAPLARSVRDLRLFVEAVEPARVRGRFAARRGADEAPTDVASLRIGIVLDGPMRSAPAVRRAVCAAAEALDHLGANVELFSPPDVGECMRLFAGVFSADGGARLRRALRESALDRRLEIALEAMEGAPLTLERYWQLVDECHRYRASFAEALDDQRLDVLISPASSLPAVPHGTSSATRDGQALTSLHSLLGSPAGVVAASRVRPEEEHDPGLSPASAAGRVNAGSAGLPVGVQVAGRPGADRLVLGVMERLEQAFRHRPEYPACALPPSATTTPRPNGRQA